MACSLRLGDSTQMKGAFLRQNDSQDWIQFLVGSLMLFMTLGVGAQSGTLEPTGDKTMSFEQSRDQSDLLEGEYLDLRTGSLSWEISILSIPGPNSFDLDVKLSHGKSKKHKENGDTYLAGNWELEVPRLHTSDWYPHGSGSCLSPYALYAEPVGGTPRLHWAGSGLTFMGPNNSYVGFLKNTEGHLPAEFEYTSLNNWALDCGNANGDVVTISPEGRRYTFGPTATEKAVLPVSVPIASGYILVGNDDSERYQFVKEISDNLGNSLVYTYSTNTYDGNTQQVLERIDSSDGKQVLFGYLVGSGGKKYLSEITYDQSMWQLRYSNGELYEIELPNGYKYSMAHEVIPNTSHGHYVSTKTRIDWIETPKGARIDYEYSVDPYPYNHFNLGHGGFSSTFPVTSRELDGIRIEPILTSYTYTKPDNDTNRTELVTGFKKQRYEYHRFGDKHSSLKSHSVFDTQLPGGPVRLANFEWLVGEKIGSLSPYGQYPSDAFRKPKYLAIATTDGIYETRFQNFDNFGNPQTVVEQGSGARTRNITYTNSLTEAYWSIGRVEDEEVLGYGSIDRTYFGNGLLDSVVTYGLEARYTYHPNGYLREEISRQKLSEPEIKTKYEDYKYGVARLVTYADGSLKTRDVDDWGNITRETDQEGGTTNYVFDSVGRLSSVSYPGQAVSSIDWVSPDEKITTKGNFREIVRFDGLGREREKEKYDVTKSDEKIVSWTDYDEFGNVSFRSFDLQEGETPVGFVYAYDVLDRNIATENTADSSSTFRNFAFLGQKLRVTETSPRGGEKTYLFDTFGGSSQNHLETIIETVSEGVTKTTSIQRNLIGDITEISQGSLTRSYIYDPVLLREVASELNPESGQKTHSYDLSANRTTTTYQDGASVTFAYDKLNREVGRTFSDTTSDLSYEYYKTGELKSASDTNSSWEYGYNAARLLTSETLSIDGQSYRTEYVRDLLGNIDVMVYPSGMEIGYAPDALGRPSRVGEFVHGIHYFSNGRPERYTYGNGDLVTFSQNARYLTDRKTVSSNTAGSVIDLEYDYDTELNVRAIIDHLKPESSKSFSYDNLSQLVSATSDTWGGAVVFEYDSTGSRTAKTSASIALTETINPVTGQLDSVSDGTTFTYDAKGAVSNKSGIDYDFNLRMELISVDQGTIEFEYDAHGNRTKKSTTNEDVYTGYSLNDQLIFERASGGSLIEYVYFDGKLVAKIDQCSVLDSDGDGIPDCFEILWGLDVSDASDALLDTDSDGLTNLEEYQNGLDANNGSEDSDLDGMTDSYEISYGLLPLVRDDQGDLDSDSLTNIEEYVAGTAPNSIDSDLDGMDDFYEIQNSLNPLFDDANSDKDGDGLLNINEFNLGSYANESDSDQDGMSDNFEVQYGLLVMQVDGGQDLDGDGLSNLYEFQLGLNPSELDSDSDGMDDEFEVSYGLDPLSDDTLLDLDGDGLTNIAEFTRGLNPNAQDTDGDGLIDSLDGYPTPISPERAAGFFSSYQQYMLVK